MLPTQTGYGWSAESGRYIDLETGRFVKFSNVREALEGVMDASAVRMNLLTEQLTAGSINLAEWQTGMMEQIKISHVAATASAKGGWAQVGPSEWGEAGQLIRQQYDYLRNFAKEIADGTQALDGRALVRADMYGDAVRDTFEEIRKRDQIAAGMEEEIRDLEPGSDHCEGCDEQAALGWQPIGTLSDIGDEDCMTRCKCNKRYRRLNEDGEWEESE